MQKQNIKGAFSYIDKIIKNIENSKAPLVYFILTFVFCVTLRTFIEFISDNTRIRIEYFMHYLFFYVAISCFAILLFYLLSKKPIIKLIKIILPSFFVLIIAPIIDLIFSKGKGYNMGYILPEVHGNLLLRFFTFTGNFSGSGITLGMKLEIILVLLGIFIYLFLSTKRISKGLLGVFGFYVILFIFSIMPFIVKQTLSFFDLPGSHSDTLMCGAYLLIIFIMSIIIAFYANKEIFRKIISEFSWVRLAHFEFMFILGVILGIKESNPYIHTGNVLNFALIPVSIFFAGLYSLITNNLEDYDIDKVSNPKRILVAKKITKKTYEKISYIALILAIVYALAAGYKEFIIILLFLGNYFLYSARPLRLKRIPLFSKALIALNSLILVILGFLMITSDGLHEVPSYIYLLLAGFTLVINFIDIKDYKGDKQQGILTLPVILGLRNSKILIGIFFVAVYPMVYFISPELLYAALVAGFIHFYLINKKKYNETHVFIFYLLTILLFLIYILHTL
ncbi:MAG: UbiA family prenyltransferase [Nanobdellota archaeon]